jgi:hypothetical protein
MLSMMLALLLLSAVQDVPADAIADILPDVMDAEGIGPPAAAKTAPAKMHDARPEVFSTDTRPAALPAAPQNFQPPASITAPAGGCRLYWDGRRWRSSCGG